VTRIAAKRPLIVSVDAQQTDKPWIGRLVRFFGTRVQAFVGSDESTASWLLSKSPSASVAVIRPGVTAPNIKSRELRSELELPTDARLIAVAGPLERRKEIDEAIWHFELVRVLHEKARLLIFGDGPDRARLERFAEEVSDRGCICFLGFRNDFLQVLPAADAYWQLDRSLTTPMGLLEAQAAGVPVIASDIPSHRTAVIDEETGLVVPYGVRAEIARATDRLFTDRTLAERLAKNAVSSVAANWNAESSIRAYERLYEQVFAKTSG
jgi:glycosyltransferase involved in cell wall biosynthesis